MARRKKRLKFKYTREAIGIILLFLSIMGIGKFGVVGEIVKAFFVFLFGYFYLIGIALLVLISFKIIFKSLELDNLKFRILGFFLVLLGLLVIFQVIYSVEHSIEIIETIPQIFESLIYLFRDGITIIGGGMIGAGLSLLLIKGFSIIGTYIVASISILIGIIVLFRIPIFKIIKDLFKKLFTKKEFEIKTATNNKKIISNIEELNKSIEKSEEKHEFASINNSNYILPNINEILDNKKKINVNENKNIIKNNVEKLEQVLLDFDITAKVVGVNVGPAVTQYEMEVKSGTKVNRILGINREIALALAAKDVRIQAPIPGRNTIGIELPNSINSIVSLKEVIDDIPKTMNNSKLCVALGKNIMGKTIFMEINKTPHLLVSGATGSGKSCCINSIIITLLSRATPDEVKLVLVDPKKVEMSIYNGCPHLLMPVVTDPRKASVALMKMVSEMEKRYELFDQTNTKNIVDYNNHMEKKNLSNEKIPYIVIIIDELADLMLIASKEVEDSIMRITQMARASGIHLIVATQRPSTDVITGLVKSNIPSRISFAVSSSIDSRTILDMTGAEKLLGKGDMLFLPMGENSPIRIQGSYVTDEEIKRMVDYTVTQQKAKFDEKYIIEEKPTKMHTDEEYEDPLYEEIVEFVIKNQKASASLLQRKYKLGYNRAARIVDLLEERGIVGPQNGSKPREVLVELDRN